MKTKPRRDVTAKRLAPFCLCGAQMSLTYLRTLLAEVDGVRQGEEPECLHRLRVAARRLRSLLPLYTVCVSRQACARWRKQLRRLTRTLGTARDVDVQLDGVASLLQTGVDALAQVGLARVQVRLRQQRQALQQPVRTALQRFLESAVHTDMEQTLTQVIGKSQPYAEAPVGRRAYRKMRQVIRKRLTVLEKYGSWVQEPDNLTALHAMRIAVKRLRYTMQALAPLYQGALAEPVRAAQTLQDLLGDIHDCDVWAAQLPPFLEAERARTEAYFGDGEPFTVLVPGILALQYNRAHLREQRYQAFVDFWQQSQEQGVWEQLRQTLEAPLQPAAEEAQEADTMEHAAPQAQG